MLYLSAEPSLAITLDGEPFHLHLLYDDHLVYASDDNSSHTYTCEPCPLVPLYFLFVQVNHFQDYLLIEAQFSVARQQECTSEGQSRVVFSL